MKNVRVDSIQQDGHEQCPSLKCNLHFNDREKRKEASIREKPFFWGGEGFSSVKG